MFGPDGSRTVGHGMVPEIDIVVIEAQMQKRLQDISGYEKNIREEFEFEQPDYFPIVEGVAEKLAEKHIQRDTPEWDDFIDTMKFMTCFTYKLASLALESKHMESTIVL